MPKRICDSLLKYLNANANSLLFISYYYMIAYTLYDPSLHIKRVREREREGGGWRGWFCKIDPREREELLSMQIDDK